MVGAPPTTPCCGFLHLNRVEPPRSSWIALLYTGKRRGDAIIAPILAGRHHHNPAFFTQPARRKKRRSKWWVTALYPSYSSASLIIIILKRWIAPDGQLLRPTRKRLKYEDDKSRQVSLSLSSTVAQRQTKHSKDFFFAIIINSNYITSYNIYISGRTRDSYIKPIDAIRPSVHCHRIVSIHIECRSSSTRRRIVLLWLFSPPSTPGMRYCGGPETNQEGLSLFLPLLVCLLHSGPSLTNGQQQQQQLVSPTERRTHTQVPWNNHHSRASSGSVAIRPSHLLWAHKNNPPKI